MSYTVHGAHVTTTLAKVKLEGGEEITVARAIVVAELVPDNDLEKSITWVVPVADKKHGEVVLDTFKEGNKFGVTLTPIKEG